MVDDEDYDHLNSFRWHAHKGKSSLTLYAISSIGKGMHNELIKVPDGFVIDHIDRNGLNNQKNNLRIVTASQNQMNKTVKCGNHSKYRGVDINTIKSKGRIYTYFRVGIKLNNKHIHIGRYKDEKMAAKAYNEAAKKYHGEFAILNIIE